MTMLLTVANTRRTVQSMWVGVGGQWRIIRRGWLTVGGTERVFFDGAQIALTPKTLNAFSFSESPVSAGVRFLNNGLLQVGSNNFGSTPVWANAAGEWMTPATASLSSSFELFLTQVSSTGSGTLAATTNTWLDLAVSRTLVGSLGGAGIASWVFDATIRRKANTSDAVTARITISLQSEGVGSG